MTRAYRDLVIEDRRLVILRLTAEGNGAANSSILLRGIDAWGLPCSARGLRDDLAWLAERGLVERSDAPGGPEGVHQIVRITREGRDVVRGVVAVDGITAPSSM